jgi:predicted membrane-bound spermidine synthase
VWAYLASYLLGDSVTQFSTIIGSYLFAMGIGSWLSRFLKGNLLSWFVRLEIMVGLVGGCSAAVLFLLFEQVTYFKVVLYGQVILTGILVGLELPVLMRILKDKIEFNDLVSRIFTFDYIGALFASLLFPLVLIPTNSKKNFLRGDRCFGRPGRCCCLCCWVCWAPIGSPHFPNRSLIQTLSSTLSQAAISALSLPGATTTSDYF